MTTQQTIVTKDRLLRTREAAELLACSDRNIYLLIANGKLERVKLGRSTRVRLRDVEALIENGCD